jgi:hypothetical protein
MLPQLAVVVWAEALVEQAPIPVTVGQPAEQQAREFLPQIALPLLMREQPFAAAAAFFPSYPPVSSFSAQHDHLFYILEVEVKLIHLLLAAQQIAAQQNSPVLARRSQE